MRTCERCGSSLVGLTQYHSHVQTIGGSPTTPVIIQITTVAADTVALVTASDVASHDIVDVVGLALMCDGEVHPMGVYYPEFGIQALRTETMGICSNESVVFVGPRANVPLKQA